MKPAAAVAKFFVALFALLTAILSLATSLLSLIVALLTRATAAVWTSRERPADDTNKKVAPPALRLVQPAPAAAPKPAQPSNAERVAFALKGMGFKAPEVERAIKSVSNVELLPVETAIKTALQALARVA